MSRLLSKRLYTRGSGKYSCSVTFTYQEAKEAWIAVDTALKLARKRKNDKTLPTSTVLVESQKAQVLSLVKRGLQEGLEQLKKGEQARREGRWKATQGEKDE